MKNILIIMIFSSISLFGQIDSTKIDSIKIVDYKTKIAEIEKFQKHLQKEYEKSETIKAYLRNQILIIESKK
jgi:hypothetical protein